MNSFYLYTCIGIAAAILHVLLPLAHRRVGAASAIALGIGGAWNGALFLAAFHQGGWAHPGLPGLVGAIVGAVGALAGMELLARQLMHEEET